MTEQPQGDQQPPPPPSPSYPPPAGQPGPTPYPGAYPQPPGQPWGPPGQYAQHGQPWGPPGQYAQPSGQQGYPPPGQVWGALAGPRNGLGTAGLVLGIIGLVTSWLVVGIVPAILALIFGLIGRARVRRQEATNGTAALAGAILGVVAIVASIVAFVLWRHYVHDHCYRYEDGSGHEKLQCDNGGTQA